jgi:hypothetical protein
MKTLKTFLLATLLIICAAGSLSWFFWQSRTTWPSFPSDIARGQAPTAEQQAAAQSLTPEVVVVVDHDYAYRIGDAIPVTIFLKEKKGTEIDLHSMALEGDFEIAGDPVFFVRQTADGARRIRVDIKLQSFNAVPKWAFNANMSYRVIATNDDITVSLPALVVYTSNTWDGRDIIQEGKLVLDRGFEPFATGALLLGGLLGTIFFFRLARRYSREQPVELEMKNLPNRFLLARRDFNDVWALMEAGDRSADRYADISAIVRRLYRVETKTTLEAGYYMLYSYNGPLKAVEILQACDRVIYRDETLSEEDHQQIKKTFDQQVQVYPAELLVKLPPTKVVLKSEQLKPSWR